MRWVGWGPKKIALHAGTFNLTRRIVLKEFDRPLTIALFLNYASSETRTKLIDETYKMVDEYIKATANTFYN